MSKTILLADDSATIRKIVELTFDDSGFQVETVSGGEEALERFVTLQPDVVVADVAMPAPNGYEVCRRIKQSDRPVPVVLLVGTFERFDEQEAARCGADGHLKKPFESEVLLRKVEAVLEASAPAEPAVAPGRSAGTAALDAAATLPGVSTPVRTVPVEERSPRLAPEEIEAVAREVVRQIGEDVVRRVAREVLPEVAERLVRERIRELETEE